jgi:phage shock protein A
LGGEYVAFSDAHSRVAAVFDRLRAALRAALDAATPPANARDLARDMREAVIEMKAAVEGLRETAARLEAELALERRRLADAERRGRLAGEIQDQDTVDVAARFATRHRERMAVLERKVAAGQEELALAERDLAEMRAELGRAERERPATEAERSAERAWREIERSGGVRPDLAAELDQAAREATVDQQLRDLKKRMQQE